MGATALKTTTAEALEVVTHSTSVSPPRSSQEMAGIFLHCGEISRVKLFYTGPVVNAEMLVVMLEKHGIRATQEFADPAAPDNGDLSREANVFVPEADYERAQRLFYSEREDEL